MIFVVFLLPVLYFSIVNLVQTLHVISNSLFAGHLQLRLKYCLEV